MTTPTSSNLRKDILSVAWLDWMSFLRLSNNSGVSSIPISSPRTGLYLLEWERSKCTGIVEKLTWSQGPVYNFSLFMIFVTAMASEILPQKLSELKNVLLVVESALLWVAKIVTNVTNIMNTKKTHHAGSNWQLHMFYHHKKLKCRP